MKTLRSESCFQQMPEVVGSWFHAPHWFWKIPTMQHSRVPADSRTLPNIPGGWWWKQVLYRLNGARLRWRVKWWLGQLQKSHAIITSDVWLPSDQRCALSPQWKETMAGWCGGVSWDVGDLIRGVSLPLRYPQTISVQGSTFIWGWHWRGHNYFHNQDVNDGILSKYKYTGYHSHQ